MKINIVNLLSSILGVLLLTSQGALGQDRQQKAPSLGMFDENLVGGFVDRSLDGWKRGMENDASPPVGLLNRNLDVTGTWRVKRGYNSTTFWIRRMPSRKYAVTMMTAGCGGLWKLRREGTLKDGVLTLNRPVEEYSPLTYDRLFALRVEGIDYLVPDVSVKELTNKTGSWGKPFSQTLVARLRTFARIPPVASKPLSED